VCGQPGHNRRRCPANATPAGLKPAKPVAPSEGRLTPSSPPRTSVGMSPPNRYRGRLRDIRPASLMYIERSLRDGRWEDWSDLADTIARDPHVAGLIETCITGVSGARWDVEPASDEPADVAASDLVRLAMDRMGFHGLLSELLWADMVGARVIELDWRAQETPWGMAYLPDWYAVPTRDLEFDRDWALRIRSYEVPGSTTYRWIRLPTLGAPCLDDDADLDGFLVYFGQRAGQPPTFSGDLLTVAQTWLYKHWAEIYFAIINEKSGHPTTMAKVDSNTPGNVRRELLENLANLQPGQALVVDDGVEVSYLETSGGDNAGENQDAIISRYNREMTKALHGSVDNVESDGGSRARAESQARTSLLPRHYASAERLRSMLDKQLVSLICRFNSHILGQAKSPALSVALTVEEVQVVSEHLLRYGMVVTQDEARASAGLGPLEGDRGAAELPGEGQLNLPGVSA